MTPLLVCVTAGACASRGRLFQWEASGRGTSFIVSAYWRDCPEELRGAAVELSVGEVVGPDGVIAELQQLGYEVRRI